MPVWMLYRFSLLLHHYSLHPPPLDFTPSCKPVRWCIVFLHTVRLTAGYLVLDNIRQDKTSARWFALSFHNRSQRLLSSLSLLPISFPFFPLFFYFALFSKSKKKKRANHRFGTRPNESRFFPIEIKKKWMILLCRYHFLTNKKGEDNTHTKKD